MRGYLAHKNGHPPVKLIEDEKNPLLLASRDLDAFATVRKFQQALEDGAIELVKRLESANPDLAPYFKWIVRRYMEEHARPLPTTS